MDNDQLSLQNPSGLHRYDCYASWPGSGPKGETCAKCRFLVADKSKYVCSKYKALTGHKGRPISSSSFACRYFEPRPDPRTLKGA